MKIKLGELVKLGERLDCRKKETRSKYGEPLSPIYSKGSNDRLVQISNIDICINVDEILILSGFTTRGGLHRLRAEIENNIKLIIKVAL